MSSLFDKLSTCFFKNIMFQFGSEEVNDKKVSIDYKAYMIKGSQIKSYNLTTLNRCHRCFNDRFNRI